MANKSPEINDLLEALCNDTLSVEQSKRMRQILHADPAARQFYRDYLTVHSEMVAFARKEASMGADSLDANGADSSPMATEDLRASGFSPANPRQTDRPRQTDQHLLVKHRSQSGYAERSSRGTWLSVRNLSWAAGLAAMLLIGLFTAYQHAGWGGAASSGQQAAFVRSDAPRPGGNAGVGQPTDQSALASGVVTANDRGSFTNSGKAQPLYVAQVTGVSPDVQWGDSATTTDFLLRIRRGDRIDLRAGFVEVEYFSGALVLLNGPCVFVPTGERSGRLEQGRLTGEVSRGDFLLTTPTAKVIDLGTQFGVAVDASNTDVCVFDGKVQVIAERLRDDSVESLFLEEGMAARVARGGVIAANAKVDTDRFTRQLPAFSPPAGPVDELSLVNLFSGRHGGRFRLAGVIAPDTGNSDQRPWLRVDGPGYITKGPGGYQVTSWHPYVDGVFIPGSKGQATRINSDGDLADLPASTGRTWGPVWSRRRADNAVVPNSRHDYWGTDTLQTVVDRLEGCQTGMIGIHSNVGISFDLDAIRRFSGKSLDEFRSVLSNLDSSLTRLEQLDVPEGAKQFREWVEAKGPTADLRVYVDGKLRTSRLGFGRDDGEQTLSISLSAEDRFLTIVSTDAGGPYPDAYDHVVLIDPVVVLAED